MNWYVTSQAEWVTSVNRGDIWPMVEDASVPFTLARLTSEAAGRLGTTALDVVHQLGEDAIEALDVLLPALEHEARLTILGRWITHRFLGRLVEQRLAVEGAFRAYPTLLEEQIIEPWFVIGAPRTGTTVLYGLLGQDERHRTPKGWEFLRPAPPAPDGDDLTTRIALADIELRTPQVIASELLKIHEYSAEMPKECLSAMSLAFRSEEFVARYDIPSYEHWLHSADARPAYNMHKRVLQVLQHGGPAHRWVLKCPVHLQQLPTLLAVYPDSRLSATHRDLNAVLPSVSSLVATMRSVHSDEVDAAAIGRYHIDLYATTLAQYVKHVDEGLLSPERLTNSRFADLRADPLSLTQALYAHFDWPLAPSTVERMEDYLAEHDDGGGGGHRYDASSFGIDRDEVTALFARYTARFLDT